MFSLLQNTVICMDSSYFNYYFHRFSLSIPLNDLAYKLHVDRQPDSTRMGKGRATFTNTGLKISSLWQNTYF